VGWGQSTRATAVPTAPGQSSPGSPRRA
jgi:hypothetical protein